MVEPFEHVTIAARNVDLTPADARRVLELGLALQCSAGESRPVRLDART